MTGIITINGSLDRESQDTYQFEVTVIDINNSAQFAFPQIRVVALDSNDLNPVFG